MLNAEKITRFSERYYIYYAERAVDRKEFTVLKVPRSARSSFYQRLTKCKVQQWEIQKVK
jgi:hypothetical protein